MSHNSKNTDGQQQPAVIDYDRQFQEDLERAQALSLESLALEKFKLQKKQSECGGNYAIQQQQQQQQQKSNSHAASHCPIAETDGTLIADR